MNNSSIIFITKKFSLETDLQDFLMSEDNANKFYRIYRVFTTKVNNQTGCQKFSLSANTITFYSKNKIISDFVQAGDEFTLKDVNGFVKYYLVEAM